MQRHRVVAIALVVTVGTAAAYLVARDDGRTTARASHGPGRTSSSSSSSTSSTEPVASTATTPSSTTPGTTAPSVEPVAPFRAAIATVTAAQLGASWRPGCPVPVEQLRAVDVTYWGYDGQLRQGRLVVHADQAERVVRALRALYDARFPIERMTPIDAYGGDDQASMRANNTSGFNCRVVAGTSRWSEHAFGRAIDVNPLVNPYVRGSSVDPPEGAPYADRGRREQGMIHAGDDAVAAFAAVGWGWGGSWSNGKDYQHFSASGR